MASPYNLYKFGDKVSPHILHKKKYCDLNLGESLCILTFFLFSDSGLNLLNGFDFYFEWHDTENQQIFSDHTKLCSLIVLNSGTITSIGGYVWPCLFTLLVLGGASTLVPVLPIES